MKTIVLSYARWSGRRLLTLNFWPCCSFCLDMELNVLFLLFVFILFYFIFLEDSVSSLFYFLIFYIYFPINVLGKSCFKDVGETWRWRRGTLVFFQLFSYGWELKEQCPLHCQFLGIKWKNISVTEEIGSFKTLRDPWSMQSQKRKNEFISNTFSYLKFA